MVPIEIRCGGKKHSVKAAVSSSLTHPLILGLDWAGFLQAVRGTRGMSSAYDQGMAIDWSKVRPDAALTYPHFIVVRDRLYRS